MEKHLWMVEQKIRQKWFPLTGTTGLIKKIVRFRMDSLHLVNPQIEYRITKYHPVPHQLRDKNDSISCQCSDTPHP